MTEMPSPARIHQVAVSFQTYLGTLHFNDSGESLIEEMTVQLDDLDYLYRLVHDTAHTAGSGDGSRGADLRWSNSTANLAIAGSKKFMRHRLVGIAACREGFDFMGIEREAEYVEIARARIIGDAPLFNEPAELEESA